MRAARRRPPGRAVGLEHQEINGSFPELSLALVGTDLVDEQVEPGQPLPQVVDHGHEHRLDDALEGADDHGAGDVALEGHQGTTRVGELGLDAFGRLHQDPARRREHRAARLPVEDCDSRLLLELRDLLRDRRRGDAHGVGSSENPACTVDVEQDGEPAGVQMHEVELNRESRFVQLR